MSTERYDLREKKCITLIIFRFTWSVNDDKLVMTKVEDTTDVSTLVYGYRSDDTLAATDSTDDTFWKIKSDGEIFYIYWK